MRKPRTPKAAPKTTPTAVAEPTHAERAQAVIESFEDEKPEVEEAPAASGPAAQVEKPKFKPQWVKLARERGMDDDDINSFDDTNELRDYLLANGSQRDSHAERARAADGTFAKEKTPTPETAKPFSLKDLGLNGEEFDDGRPASEILTKALEPIMQRMLNVERQLEESGTRERQREARAQFNEIDALFNKHPEIFGEGDAGSLDQTSDFFLRRDAVVRAMGQDKQSRSIGQAFKVAAGKYLGRSKTAPVVEDTEGFENGKTLAPPDRAPVMEKKGEKLATRNLERRLREREKAIKLNGAATRPEDEFPDENYET